MPERIIEISSKTLWQIFFVILGLFFLYFAREVVAIFFAALIIASFVDLMSDNLRKFKIPRFLGVIMIYLMFILILAVLSYFVIPTLIIELKILANQLPSLLENTKNESEIFRNFVFLDDLKQFLDDFVSGLLAGGSFVVGASGRVIGGAFTIVSIFVISFYLSLQEKGIENLLRFIIPKKQENYIIDLWLRSQRKMGRWLQGQLILSLIIGVAVFIGLSLLGVRHALILAVIAGIFELLPIVGPIISAIPAILIAGLQNPFLGLLTLTLYVFIQQLENHLVVPNIMKQATGLNPAIVIIVLLIGMKSGGILGMLLAVPLAAVLAEFFMDIAKKKPEETVIAKVE